MQLSITALYTITTFDPSQYQFNISLINTKLSHLFVLATTSNRSLTEEEKLQHTLTAYDRIKQPDVWNRWVQTQIDQFDEGGMTSCQDFMNTAAIKYLKLKQKDGFGGSLSTIQDDIVSMVTAIKRKRPAKDDNDNTNKTSTDTRKVPPFISHTRHNDSASGHQYKVGDSKTWNNKKWYFCDCPNHRFGNRWHVFPTTECRTRKKWLEDNKTNSKRVKIEPNAHNAVLQSNSDDEAKASNSNDHDDASTNLADPEQGQAQNNPQVMLAAALQSLGDNPVKDLVADALNLLMEE